jgi:zinc protease
MSQSVPAERLVPSPTGANLPGAAAPEVSHFKLANGLTVVVIPDRRAPVVTHMVWYRNGSADDPPGKSGIAHFLEHLMFKGTKTVPAGVFSNTVAELGGQENAFTSYDYTAYYQRVATEHLGEMMRFESDRMNGLVLSDEVVAPERDVVLEERRMRVDGDPSAQLEEAVQASLFVHHPYGKPIIGWQHEIEGFAPNDALAYYRRFYTPENATLIIAGDVEPEAVRRLAEETYGRLPAHGEAPRRLRPKEPELRAQRRVTIADPRVQQPHIQRIYLVPSSTTADARTSAALEVLAHVLGGGQTSLLYKQLLIDQKIAVSAGSYYQSHSVDDTRFMVYAYPAQGVPLDALDRAVDEVIAGLVENGVDDEILVRSKSRLVAEAVYAQDSQVTLAHWYGSALSTGLSVDDVKQWPGRIEAVTADDVRSVAKRFLDPNRAVTGYLMMDQAQAA